MTPLSCRVRKLGAATCVTVSGSMAMASVAALRTVLLKCLAECPTAVIVDLSQVTVQETLALSVFPAVRQHAADWPAVPLLLCGLRPMPHPAIRRVWLFDVPVYHTVDEALMAASQPEMLTRRVQARLAHNVDAPARAREVVAAACHGWGLDELVPTAQLIASELSSNAVCHTDGSAKLVLIRGERYLHVVVRDGDPRLPVMAQDGEFDAAGDRGRGLRLIGALAARWGALAVGEGKAVWATLPLSTLG
jgi:anti-anti-sigma regulatory factor